MTAVKARMKKKVARGLKAKAVEALTNATPARSKVISAATPWTGARGSSRSVVRPNNLGVRC